MIVFESQFVRLEYLENDKRLIQRWESFVPSDVFRDAIDRTVEFLKSNEVLSIISDTQKQEVVKPEDAEYAASVMPQLYNLGLKVMAFVIPDNVFTRFSLNKFANVQNDHNVEYFLTMNEAEFWIASRVK